MSSARSKTLLSKNFDSSMWMLVAANLIPLAGVLFWDWSIFEVVALYWLENVIIGGINILKMVTCSSDPEALELGSRLQKRWAQLPGTTDGQDEPLKQAREMMDQLENKAGCLKHGMKLFLVPFFTVHYGMFCLVHGVFVMVLLGGGGPGVDLMSNGPGFPSPVGLASEAIADGGIWAALALVISHLYSFATNYLGKGEYRRTAVPLIMLAPYGRIVVLHIAILFGAFAIMALGSPLFLLVLLIAGKIALDLKLHLRSHRKLTSDESAEKK